MGSVILAMLSCEQKAIGEREAAGAIEAVQRQRPHLIPLPQQRQLIAVDGAFHHVDVVVLDAEVQIPEPEHNTGRATWPL